jgi:putative N6-adenine-specific DNA methylase
MTTTMMVLMKRNNNNNIFMIPGKRNKELVSLGRHASAQHGTRFSYSSHFFVGAACHPRYNSPSAGRRPHPSRRSSLLDPNTATSRRGMFQRASSSSPTSKATISLDGQVSVTCLPGLEGILRQEIRVLQLSPSQQHDTQRRRLQQQEKQQKQQQSSAGTKTRRGEVDLSDYAVTANDVLRACLYLGTATNVRIRCGPTFTARGLSELRRKTALLEWPKILQDPVPARLQLRVRVTSSKSKLYHTAAIGERVLRGILDSFGHASEDHFGDSHQHDVVEKTTHLDGPTVQLEVLLWRDQVDVFVNASATPLHQRGYRLQTAKAPLREDLAFAMLFAAGWVPDWARTGTAPGGNHDESPWTGLLDPFCGSGTIAIEGAAMAMGLPPGRLRVDQFLDGTVWKEQQQVGNDRPHHDQMGVSGRADHPGRVPISVAASDRDAGAVQATRGNAERAGVLKVLNIQESSFSSQPWLDDPTTAPTSLLVVTNPPFGNRISPPSKLLGREIDRKEGLASNDDPPGHLLSMYQKLGHSLIKFGKRQDRTVGAVVLTDNRRLLNRLGLSLSVETLFQTTHGGLPVSAVRLGCMPPPPANSNKS